jgi:hypothetical protein
MDSLDKGTCAASECFLSHCSPFCHVFSRFQIFCLDADNYFLFGFFRPPQHNPFHSILLQALDFGVNLLKLFLHVAVCPLLNQDAAGRSLGLTRQPQSFLRIHKYVGDIVVLTKNGQVANNIDWRNISGDHTYAFLTLADLIIQSNQEDVDIKHTPNQITYRLNNFLDAASDTLGFRSCRSVLIQALIPHKIIRIDYQL